MCTNGLIVSRAAFPAYCVSHRGNIVDDVVASALKIAGLRPGADPPAGGAFGSLGIPAALDG